MMNKAFNMRPQSMRMIRKQVQDSLAQKQSFQPNTGLFAGIKTPNYIPVNSQELDGTSPAILLMVNKKLQILSQNIAEITETVAQITQLQASQLKLEQQVENHFYGYIEEHINPKLLKTDQKISHLVDILDHPDEKYPDISTIELAEKVAEIEQQVLSDSMTTLVDDVTDIKKMLVQIQKKLDK